VNTTRRQFIRIGAAAGGGLYFSTRISGVKYLVQAQIPGGTLDPLSVAKYRTPLLIPPVMPMAGTIRQTGGKNIDYYEISMKQISQQILPAGLPATRVWGYGAVAAADKRGLLLHNAPSLTIEAQWNRPVRIKWINDLRDASGNYLPHLLPVDPTLHWANPPGGAMGRDTRPTFTSTPGRYTGPVPMVTHVHGAVGVGDESDGYAEAWYLPVAGNIPPDYADRGTWYDFFASKAAAGNGTRWGPGYAVFQYPNLNRASTIWYHDHTLGMTRLNVYAGPAGFYIIRGGPDGDSAVMDSRTLAPAVLPGPAPSENDKFPPNKTYYEIPIAIQDRSFNSDGSLFYPDTREFFDGIEGPFIPFGMTHEEFSPIWNPERLRLALPHPGLQQHPWRRGLADWQRRRVPRRAGQHHGVGQPPAPRPRRARGHDRGLHERACGTLRAGEHRPGRALRRRRAGRRLPCRRVAQHRPDHAVPRRAGRCARPHDAPEVPRASGHRSASGTNRHPAARACREDGHGVRRCGRSARWSG
jgi:spore coat protein A, manganese oxidase